MRPKPNPAYFQLIALGSNLASGSGTSRQTLEKALSSLAQRGVSIRACSRFFSTRAFPPGSGPDFVNAAAVVDCGGGAAGLLAHLHAVEAELGRVRAVRWGARTVDLDLIAYGAQVSPDVQTQRYWRELPEKAQQAQAPDQLILPHPRVQDRAFVLVPLMDVAPDWTHPLLGKTVRQMHDALSDAVRAEVIAL